MQHSISKKFIKVKKLYDTPCWYYNHFLKQHLCNSDGPMYFYDENFNFLFKEPKLRHAENVEFIDEDLCVFNIEYLNKVIFYSMTKREIVSSIILRLPKNMGEAFYIKSAWYFKNTNTIIFKGSWHNKEESISCKKVFAYNISLKKYTELYGNSYTNPLSFSREFVFNDKYIVLMEMYGDEDKSLLIFNEDLSYELVKIDNKIKELYNNRYFNFDAIQGVIMFGKFHEGFDGYTYYGTNYCREGIDLTGKVVPWEPLNINADYPYEEEHKKTDFDSEGYIRKNGIDAQAINNCTEDELIHGGYFWALDKIEAKANAAGISLQDFIGNEQISEKENVLFSIGWFETEIGEGGIEQYFTNVDDAELSALIKALNQVKAPETAKLIKKAATIPAEDKKRTEKLERLQEQITEDYVTLTIDYIKSTLSST